MYISRQEDHFSLLSVHPYLCLEVLAGTHTLKRQVLIGQWARAPHIVMAYPTSRERAKKSDPQSLYTKLVPWSGKQGKQWVYDRTSIIQVNWGYSDCKHLYYFQQFYEKVKENSYLHLWFTI